MQRLYLVRHPEAEKNVRDSHGGCGSALTNCGYRQLEDLINYFSIYTNAATIIYGHWVQQVRYSAEKLHYALNAPLTWDDRLRGIHLGVLSGLTREEAERRYPEDAARLEGWRQGTLPIHRLNIQGAEPLRCFRERVEAVYREWLTLGDVTIVAVLTRSTLIMLTNLVHLGSQFSYDNYKVYDFASGSITLVEDNHNPRVVFLNSTAHLRSCSLSMMV